MYILWQWLHSIKIAIAIIDTCNQGWGAQPYAGLSLLKVKGKFNTDSNGADTAYICKHSACLHTQTCFHNVVIQITLKVYSK